MVRSVDVIAHRLVPVPGSVETVELRAQDPQGPFGAPMLRRLAGRYPTGPAQVAVTDGVATMFGLAVGSRFDLDGRDWRVVGLVENPEDLGDEFALASPSRAGSPDSVTILFDAGRARFDSFRKARGSPPVFDVRGLDQRAAIGAGALSLTAVVLVLICLVATSGFAVMAQRRLRQLGMLAAIGATERHVRLVIVANGAVVGSSAASIGGAVGILGWMAVASRVETAAGHRIDRLDVPWLLIGVGMVLAIGTATAAAWWPARTIARTPITHAISARPPRTRPAHGSAALAGGLVVLGEACLAFGDEKRPPLIVAGVLATALGLLFISPVAISALARLGARLPIAARLALRDLARYRTRSGSALAAISLATGIAVAIVVSATAAQYTADEGNLSDRQLLVRIGDSAPLVPQRAPAELRRLAADVARLAAALDHADVLALDMAVDPAVHFEPGSGGSDGGRPPVDLGRGRFHSFPLYVATPKLLQHYRLDRAAIGADTDVLTVQTGQRFDFAGIPARGVYATVQTIDLPRYSSAPTSLITPDALHRKGWERVRVGWLVEADRPLTTEQVSAARNVAAAAGLTIETRDDQASLSDLRSAATAAGIALALGVLAITVGLIRSESAGDLRTLTAAGATRSDRRTLTAVTAGALALLGALLGTCFAYVGLGAGHVSDIGTLSSIPLLDLGITIVGLPLMAATAGWLVSGREPPSLARHALE